MEEAKSKTLRRVLRRQVPLLATAMLLGALARADVAVPAPAREVHDRLLTLDSHLDTPANLARPGWDIMARHEYASDLSQVDYPRMIEGGLQGGFWVIYTPQGPRTIAGHHAARDAALKRTMLIREMVARHQQHFELALTAADASRIAASGKRIVYLSMENGYPVGNDPSLLGTFYELGVRMFAPVHFQANDLGDSSTGLPEWHGLSPFGKELIGAANRLGMVLDASHASDQVLDQMIALSKTPIVLSHSGCKAVYDHPRNVDDERLRKLAAAGGVIQMNAYGEYLIPFPPNPERAKALADLNARYGHVASLPAEKVAELARARRALDEKYAVPQPTFEDFMRHLLHALEVVGPDHVGIGADWDGGGGVIGMNDVAAVPKITERLLQAGYSEQDLAKIWSGNLLRVLRTAEEYSASLRKPKG